MKGKEKEEKELDDKKGARGLKEIMNCIKRMKEELEEIRGQGGSLREEIEILRREMIKKENR